VARPRAQRLETLARVPQAFSRRREVTAPPGEQTETVLDPSQAEPVVAGLREPQRALIPRLCPRPVAALERGVAQPIEASIAADWSNSASESTNARW